jgi:large conductance mechanosensitive channel
VAEKKILKKDKNIFIVKPLNFLEEFIEFIKDFGVIGLALGVIVGQTTNNLVTSIVNNLISPILGKLVGINDIKNWAPEGIKVGAFISDLINFLAILFVVYILIRFLLVYILTDDEKKKFEFLNKEVKEEVIAKIKKVK